MTNFSGMLARTGSWLMLNFSLAMLIEQYYNFFSSGILLVKVFHASFFDRDLVEEKLVWSAICLCW